MCKTNSDKLKKFLIMKVNSGKGRRVVEGRSLKQVQWRYPSYLVQPLKEEVKSNEGISTRIYTTGSGETGYSCMDTRLLLLGLNRMQNCHIQVLWYEIKRQMVQRDSTMSLKVEYNSRTQRLNSDFALLR
jgi:hypothetical protein